MSDSIYIVDSKTNAPQRIDRVSFSAIGVKERQDLEAWVLSHPELLGERLLVISAEFHQFDKSNKRLDVLALDEDGVLVIVELKLDVGGSHAELQAIRYAAFCSTMTMEDLVEEYASSLQTSTDSAGARIREFLACDELPELGDRPRIILAAGSMDDHEVTSCVLWLRRFGVDISCVELTPYRAPDGAIILVPKVIIPLPETREYTVKVEKKEASRSHKSQTQIENAALWAAVKSKFNSKGGPLTIGMNSDQPWVVTRGGNDRAHYACWRLKRDGAIHVDIGFRSKEMAENDAHLDLFRPDELRLTDALASPIQFQKDWGPTTRRLFVSVPYDGTQSVEEVADTVATLLAKLVSLTLPTLRERRLL